MARLQVKGIIPPIVTPFTNDSMQELDEKALRTLIDWQIDNGIHGIVAAGGTGEYVYLSTEEPAEAAYYACH